MSAISSAFFAASDIVDFDHADVKPLARALATGTSLQTARRCFDWVRDEIAHSIDAGREEVSCSASETLVAGTGLCFAKSHLLVALLRANGIGAGFCYQRVTLDEGDAGAGFCTHGLVAVWLEEGGWYRCDVRGNKAGIDCQFTPEDENLAYPVVTDGEQLYPGVWAQPWPEVVRRLRALPSISAFSRAPIDVQPPASGR